MVFLYSRRCFIDSRHAKNIVFFFKYKFDIFVFEQAGRHGQALCVFFVGFNFVVDATQKLQADVTGICRIIMFFSVCLNYRVKYPRRWESIEKKEKKKIMLVKKFMNYYCYVCIFYFIFFQWIINDICYKSMINDLFAMNMFYRMSLSYGYRMNYAKNVYICLFL